MFEDDDLDVEAKRLYATAFQLTELTGRFHRYVGDRLELHDIPESAITAADRAAIESEVLRDAIERAHADVFQASRDIFLDAIDEATRLIFVHIAETSELDPMMHEICHFTAGPTLRRRGH